MTFERVTCQFYWVLERFLLMCEWRRILLVYLHQMMHVHPSGRIWYIDLILRREQWNASLSNIFSLWAFFERLSFNCIWQGYSVFNARHNAYFMKFQNTNHFVLHGGLSFGQSMKLLFMHVKTWVFLGEWCLIQHLTPCLLLPKHNSHRQGGFWE